MSNPYEQNPYEQNPYQQPYQPSPYGGGGPMMPQPHPQGTTVLVLGILGLVICPILSIIALVMGNKARREINVNPVAYNNAQSVTVGRILGLVSVILWGLLILFYGAVIAIALLNNPSR